MKVEKISAEQLAMQSHGNMEFVIDLGNGIRPSKFTRKALAELGEKIDEALGVEKPEDKIKVIDEICKRHPSWGVEKEWSKFTGGMTDSGHWFFRKMLDVKLDELQAFLISIVADENKPKIPLTPQEEIDSKTFVKFSGGQVSVLEQKQIKAIYQDAEFEALFGKDFLEKGVQK